MGGQDLVIVGRRGNGNHAGVILPSTEAGLQASLQGAIQFELGIERATDVIVTTDGLVVAGQTGTIATFATDGGDPDTLDVDESIPSPLIEVARLDEEDWRLVVAADDRLLVQESLEGDTLELHTAGTTIDDPVFIDALVRPDATQAPFLGVVDGRDMNLFPILDTVPPALGADAASTVQLPTTPRLAFWREVEASAQVLAFAEGTNQIDWFKVNFDGSLPASASFAVSEVDEIFALLPAQMTVSQEELVILGRRDERLVVVAYVDALGVGGIAMGNGVREWLGPDTPGGAPLIAAADFDGDAEPGRNEIILVEPSGAVRCLDITDVALVESCGDIDLSAISTSGRPGW